MLMIYQKYRRFYGDDEQKKRKLTKVAVQTFKLDDFQIRKRTSRGVRARSPSSSSRPFDSPFNNALLIYRGYLSLKFIHPGLQQLPELITLCDRYVIYERAYIN